jgi:hypothetical protein
MVGNCAEELKSIADRAESQGHHPRRIGNHLADEFRGVIYRFGHLSSAAYRPGLNG